MIDIWTNQREKAKILENGLKVLKGQNTERTKFHLIVWRPKAINPHINYYFNTESRRDEYLNNEINNYNNYLTLKEKYKQERKGTPDQIGAVKTGDIFNFTWGYEQTNQDFFQVIAKNGRSLTLREIASRQTRATGPMSAEVVPVKDHFLKDSKPFKKLLQFSGSTPYITIKSYGWCDLWDGKPKYNSWYA